MAIVPIPGVTPETVQNTDTKPPQGGLKPFPCDAHGWTRHTATIAKAGLKCFDNGGKSISLILENGGYGGEALVSLDPTGAPDPAKAAENLVRVLKILDAITPEGHMDTGRIGATTGQTVALIAKHKGFRDGKNGGMFHKLSILVTGSADALAPVDTSVQLPPFPGAAPSDDIPF